MSLRIKVTYSGDNTQKEYPAEVVRRRMRQLLEGTGIEDAEIKVLVRGTRPMQRTKAATMFQCYLAIGPEKYKKVGDERRAMDCIVEAREGVTNTELLQALRVKVNELNAFHYPDRDRLIDKAKQKADLDRLERQLHRLEKSEATLKMSLRFKQKNIAATREAIGRLKALMKNR